MSITKTQTEPEELAVVEEPTIEQRVAQILAHTQCASDHAHALEKMIAPEATKGHDDGRRINMIDARDPLGAFRQKIAEARHFAVRLRDFFPS